MKYITKELYHNMQIYSSFQKLNNEFDKFVKNFDTMCSRLELKTNLFRKYRGYIESVKSFFNEAILTNLVMADERPDTLNYKLYDKLIELEEDFDYELNVALNNIKVNNNNIINGNFSSNIKELVNFDIFSKELMSINSFDGKIILEFKDIVLEFYGVNTFNSFELGKLPIKALYSELILHNDNNKFEFNLLLLNGELSIGFSDVKIICQ